MTKTRIRALPSWYAEEVTWRLHGAARQLGPFADAPSDACAAWGATVQDSIKAEGIKARAYADRLDRAIEMNRERLIEYGWAMGSREYLDDVYVDIKRMDAAYKRGSIAASVAVKALDKHIDGMLLLD